MWEICSHTLGTLTKLTPSKLKFKWTEVEQKASEEIKRIVTRNILLACMDFRK